MKRSRKFARFSVVRIVSRRGPRARLFGEFGTVIGQEFEEKGKPAYWVDVYRAELFFTTLPGSISEEVERQLFQPHELHATRGVDGFYGKGEPVAAARRDLARAIARGQLYVCELDYPNLRCPSRVEGIHFSENRLVEHLPKRRVTDVREHPTGNIDRSWCYVMAFNRGLVRHLAAIAPLGSWQRQFLRQVTPNRLPLKGMSGFPKPYARRNPKFSELLESLQYGELALPAARRLAECGLEGFEAMISAAANRDPFVKLAIIDTVRQSAASLCAAAFGSRAKKALLQMLLKYLEDEHWDIRSGALGALHEFKAEPELVVPALIKLLGDPECSYGAVSALGSYGPKAKRALRRLREYYKTAHESERHMVQYALRQIEGQTDGVAA